MLVVTVAACGSLGFDDGWAVGDRMAGLVVQKMAAHQLVALALRCVGFGFALVWVGGA